MRFVTFRNNGPGTTIRVDPGLTAKLDYEIELGVTIGHDIRPENAFDHVSGSPGVGFSFNPPRFLNDGDWVVPRIEGTGELANEVERRA